MPIAALRVAFCKFTDSRQVMGVEASRWDGAMFVPNLETGWWRSSLLHERISAVSPPIASEDAVRRPANLSDCANMFDSSFYIFINLLFQIDN